MVVAICPPGAVAELSARCVLERRLCLFRGWHGAVDLRMFDIYRSGDYALELRLYFDLTALVVATLASVLILATSRFSVRYLHREPGFVRFFVLMLIFAAAA